MYYEPHNFVDTNIAERESCFMPEVGQQLTHANTFLQCTNVNMMTYKICPSCKFTVSYKKATI